MTHAHIQHHGNDNKLVNYSKYIVYIMQSSGVLKKKENNRFAYV